MSKRFLEKQRHYNINKYIQNRTDFIRWDTEEDDLRQIFRNSTENNEVLNIKSYNSVLQLLHHQLWLYNPCWVFACSKRRFHSSLLHPLAFQFLMFSFPRSSCIWSLNLFRDLPFFYCPLVSGRKYVS